MPMLHDLAEISKILNRMRRRRGALDFDFPEYKVLLDHDGTPLRIVKRDRTMQNDLSKNVCSLPMKQWLHT